MDFLIDSLAGFSSGFIGALGLGGGGVLLLYLSLFLGIEQLTAQGINLIFFIPIALMSVFKHKKSGLIDKKIVIKFALLGFLGAVAGFMLANFLSGDILRKIFGGFLIILGLFSLFEKKK